MPFRGLLIRGDSLITGWISFVLTLLLSSAPWTRAPALQCLISPEQVALSDLTWRPNLDLILIFIPVLYCSLIWLQQTLALFPGIKTKWQENNHKSDTGNLSRLTICES